MSSRRRVLELVDVVWCDVATLAAHSQHLIVHLLHNLGVLGKLIQRECHAARHRLVARLQVYYVMRGILATHM